MRAVVGASRLVLAMQKVEDSGPFIRFRESPETGHFDGLSGIDVFSTKEAGVLYRTSRLFPTCNSAESALKRRGPPWP